MRDPGIFRSQGIVKIARIVKRVQIAKCGKIVNTIVNLLYTIFGIFQLVGLPNFCTPKNVLRQTGQTNVDEYLVFWRVYSEFGMA